MKIYSPETSAVILSAINSILLGNNGYADIGNDQDVIEGVRAAGFIVQQRRNLHGNLSHTGYTQHALGCLRIDGIKHAAECKPVRLHADFDYEGAILARQEKHLNY